MNRAPSGDLADSFLVSCKGVQLRLGRGGEVVRDKNSIFFRSLPLEGSGLTKAGPVRSGLGDRRWRGRGSGRGSGRIGHRVRKSYQDAGVVSGHLL